MRLLEFAQLIGTEIADNFLQNNVYARTTSRIYMHKIRFDIRLFIMRNFLTLNMSK